MKVRVTRRVGEHLEGTQAWYDVSYDRPSREDAETLGLMRKYREAPTRKDGSRTVDLTDAELTVLWEYAESLAVVGSDNAWEPDGLADLNAARACLRQIVRIKEEAVASPNDH
jgi:hypothetical protein